jgi:membrane protein implicated in regulation of membrane protease activity
MFVAIAVLAGLLSAMTYLGGPATLLLALFAAAILAHVAGNALGTRLRDGDGQPFTPLARAAAHSQPVKATEFAPTTRLRDRYSLGRPTMIATLSGAIAGGLLGGLGLTMLMNEVTAPAVGLAFGASTVLGAIWAFAAASFLQVSYTAARQATSEKEPREKEPRERSPT